MIRALAIDAHVASDDGMAEIVCDLEGHTDERGTREYNLALGERRANAVRDYMVASGVPAYRIETISYGEENPVAYGSGESNWMKNRRVEIK
jgi:peptidoglycan-associated lipoprotein